MDKMIGLAPILVNLVITLITILITHEISKHTINTNRKLNEENAGKNRAIYETEQMNISPDNKTLKEKLNNMLNSGNYTILSAFVNSGNFSETRFILGKIKP